jgi:hypothetical protein
MQETTNATTLDELVTVQFCPCGHSYRMGLSKVIKLGGAAQMEEIKAGVKLDAVIFHSSDCDDCKEERDRQDRLCREMDVDIVIAESQERCWTCHETDKPLSGWGPFCSAECRRKADGAADEAADNRYI